MQFLAVYKQTKEGRKEVGKAQLFREGKWFEYIPGSRKQESGHLLLNSDIVLGVKKINVPINWYVCTKAPILSKLIL